MLHNGAAEALFEPWRDRVDRDTFVVRYLGSVLPGHHFGAIEDIAVAVRALAAGGMNVRFEICGGLWTRHHAETLADGRAVVYRG